METVVLSLTATTDPRKKSGFCDLSILKCMSRACTPFVSLVLREKY